MPAPAPGSFALCNILTMHSMLRGIKVGIKYKPYRFRITEIRPSTKFPLCSTALLFGIPSRLFFLSQPRVQTEQTPKVGTTALEFNRIKAKLPFSKHSLDQHLRYSPYRGHLYWLEHTRNMAPPMMCLPASRLMSRFEGDFVTCVSVHDDREL